MKPAQPQLEPLTAVAFNRAVAEHGDALKTFAARMVRDAEVAEDVAQDAFLALYRHLHEVPAQAYRPWLFRVARNLCLDHIRRTRHRPSLFRDLGPEDAETPSFDAGKPDRPDQVAQRRELLRAVEEAIAALPVKFREAFLLCELQGLSYEEAAAALGCPLKTVSTRLFRARNRFRKMLERHLGPTP
jgi:RNA polymerase sigma-70 factor (ECF subfamily)